MSANYNKLRVLLQELFQLDQADLDFGIYRIMNQKRDEIVRFLDDDLLPQVKQAFGHYQSADRAEIQKELDKLVQNITNAGMNPDDSPKVKELKQKLAENVVDVTALENEVFSHLFNFFRRYYDEGDFISQRRYKEGVYAIPYEGEEVKLYWANADQYYVKSTEYLRDYDFLLSTGKRVHIRLVAGATEQDNKKPTQGRERRFLLSEHQPVLLDGSDLVIRFEFRVDAEGRKQAALTKRAVEVILSTKGIDDWLKTLSTPAPTESNPSRTVLEKHLTNYSARNTFDYFIHKGLGSFLRREFDFYIKNEVMHLDDIENEGALRAEQYLSQIRVLRLIADKVIRFLEQLEDFQKRIWLKKKFVVETQYCITLDRVPETLYPEIAKNEAQRVEWVRLFAIDRISKDLSQPGYTAPLTVEFLLSHTTLLVDTRFFQPDFKVRLLASIEDLDAKCDGLLVRSDNFQALHLLSRTWQSRVKCVYIDPPYNTDVSAIPYKNNYRHSSWAAMMHDRLHLLRELLSQRGVTFVSIDKTERSMLQYAMDSAFGAQNRIEELIWIQNTNDGRSPTYSTNHEYVEVYAKDRRSVEADIRIFREPKPGFTEVAELVRRLNDSHPPIAEIETELQRLYRHHKAELRKLIEKQGLNWDVEKRNDPWKGIYQYKFAEYRDAEGCLVDPSEAESTNARIWVFRESDWTIMSSESKQSGTTRDPSHPNFRFYQPYHPLTGKPCAMPSRGWKGTQHVDAEHPRRNSMESLSRDHRIVFGPDESKVPQQKRFLNEVSTNVCKSVFVEYADGEKQTTAMFGKTGVFLAPKHADFVRRFLRQTVDKGDVVLDCFGGSGSTAHAVISSNREEGTEAKFILVEVNDYFDTVLKPRVLKAVYSDKWKAGKPVERDGLSQTIKYIRLESYEDALNNLELKRTKQQEKVLFDDAEVREQFVLSYMLDVESRGSQSLLNIEGFRNPDQYKLKVERSGETQLVNVDLIETFNWLLGLTVKHIDLIPISRDRYRKIKGEKFVGEAIPAVRVVKGTNPDGESALVLWRNVDEMDNDLFDEWFRAQDYNVKEQLFDLIYVNGDNNLENLRRNDQTWKVRLIEDEFQRLMFDVQDV